MIQELGAEQGQISTGVDMDAFRGARHYLQSPLTTRGITPGTRGCTEQVQFSDAEIHILDQCAPMVGGGQHTSAPSGACTARVVFAQLHRSPPAAAAAQRGQVVQPDRVRCDAERQQRVGLLVDVAAAAYPSCRPAAAAKHSPKRRAQALLLLKACFQA